MKNIQFYPIIICLQTRMWICHPRGIDEIFEINNNYLATYLINIEVLNGNINKKMRALQILNITLIRVCKTDLVIQDIKPFYLFSFENRGSLCYKHIPPIERRNIILKLKNENPSLFSFIAPSYAFTGFV